MEYLIHLSILWWWNKVLEKLNSAQVHIASAAKCKSRPPSSRPMPLSLLYLLLEKRDVVVLTVSVSSKGHCRWKVEEWRERDENRRVFSALGTLPCMRYCALSRVWVACRIPHWQVWMRRGKPLRCLLETFTISYGNQDLWGNRQQPPCTWGIPEVTWPVFKAVVVLNLLILNQYTPQGETAPNLISVIPEDIYWTLVSIARDYSQKGKSLLLWNLLIFWNLVSSFMTPGQF